MFYLKAYGSFAQKVETLKRKLEETLETMNKRPSDVKLDNLDMDLSDDDGDKSPSKLNLYYLKIR